MRYVGVALLLIYFLKHSHSIVNGGYGSFNQITQSTVMIESPLGGNCSGLKIADHTYLTAAHCLVTFASLKSPVSLRISRQFEKDGDKNVHFGATVTAIFFPDYLMENEFLSRSFGAEEILRENDIAIFKVNRFQKDIPNFELTYGPPVRQGTEIYAYGYGITSPIWPDRIPTNIEKYANHTNEGRSWWLDPPKHNPIKFARKLVSWNPKEIFRANITNRWPDAIAPGDSGGPVFVWTGNFATLVGVNQSVKSKKLGQIEGTMNYHRGITRNNFVSIFYHWEFIQKVLQKKRKAYSRFDQYQGLSGRTEAKKPFNLEEPYNHYF